MDGPIYAIAPGPDFAADGLCFAASGAGLYRATDADAAWRDVFTSLNPPAPLFTSAVALSPDYANDHTLIAAAGGGVARSHDGGETWHIATTPADLSFVSCLHFSPAYAEDGVALLGTLEDGVLRSEDRGNKWVQWNFALLDFRVLCMALSPQFGTDETVFVGTETGIFRSTNGGRAWREVGFANDLAPVTCLAAPKSFGAGGPIFAGTEEKGLFASADGGQTWEPVADAGAGGSINALLPSPTFAKDKTLLALAGNRLRVSRNGGKRWQDWPTQPSADQEVLSVAAPLGLAEGAPLLLGLVEGGVVRLESSG